MSYESCRCLKDLHEITILLFIQPLITYYILLEIFFSFVIINCHYNCQLLTHVYRF